MFAYVVVVVVASIFDVVRLVTFTTIVVFGSIVVAVAVFGLINVNDNTMLVPRRRSTKSKTTICLELRN